MVRMNYYPRSVESSEHGRIEPAQRSQIQRILSLSEAICSNEREKFMRLWKPYERTVEALYCHGSLTPEEEGQYLRLHQAIGDTPV
ncbi:hypothetical protein RhiTH_007202 [Rhizoctonia solani]